MIATRPTESPAPSGRETARILADTAHAVKVMKASWLRVALNLKKIREHRLWRRADPPCESYDEYVLDRLKLNKYVAKRMLLAVEYTEERRPQLIDDFERRGDEVDVPSYEVVNQLRRVQSSLHDRSGALEDLEARVFDDGVGRVVLQREIDEKLAEPSEDDSRGSGPSKPDSVEAVLGDLMELEERLLELKVSKKAQKLLFELVEVLRQESKVTEPTAPTKETRATREAT